MRGAVPPNRKCPSHSFAPRPPSPRPAMSRMQISRQGFIRFRFCFSHNLALEQGCLVVVLATPAGHGEGVKGAKTKSARRGRLVTWPVAGDARVLAPQGVLPRSHGRLHVHAGVCGGGPAGAGGGRRAHAEGAGTRVLSHTSKAGLKWPSSSRAADCSNSAHRYPGIPGEASRILRVSQTGTHVVLG